MNVIVNSTRILITGASSGIGRQTAIRLSQRHLLLLHGRNRQRLEETRHLCHNADSHETWEADLVDVVGIASSLAPAMERAQCRIEKFVHCAGTFLLRPFRMITPELSCNLLNVNFSSAAEITRILTAQRSNGKALNAVVFVSSTASHCGAKGLSLYSATKGALDALMRSLAVELAPRVRLNSVLPGAVRTAMTENILAVADMSERMGDKYPLGIGSTDDVASVIEFLLSDAARWVTGQQIVVDGGRTINITA